MSYDAEMKIDTGGLEPVTVCDIGNHTSNTADIWRFGLKCGLSELQGKTGAELIPVLRSAIDKLTDPANRSTLRSMEPSNHWGSLPTAIDFLRKILSACEGHPKAFLDLHY